MRNRLHEIVAGFSDVPHVDIVIEPSLAGKGSELLERAQLGQSELLLVCDANTYAALGERLTHELGHAHVRSLILEAPHADGATVARLRAEPADALVAVGSGTISDLCKYASFLNGKPYIVFPTAPSMNGYLSANASITQNGYKTTLKAHLPAAVYVDLAVLAAAPLRLISSGLGDSACRTTAQADWLLSHLLLGTPYTTLPFSWLEHYEKDLFKAAEALAQRKPYAIELLMRTLLASGIGMVQAGGSYPASQGEHMLAHTMEMKFGSTLPPSYHGEQIAVTTLIMSRMQHQLLNRPVRLRRHDDWLETAVSYFGEGWRGELEHSSSSKFMLLQQKAEEVNELLSSEKYHLQDALSHVMLQTQDIERALKQAGAPTTPGELGWSEEALDKALHHACALRDRFTFLDLL